MKTKRIITIMSILVLLNCALSNAAEQDVPVLKEIFKNHFLIGGAMNRWVIAGRDVNAAALAEKHFNTATAENAMKWQRIYPRIDQYNWGPADEFMEFCEKNQMAAIGHCLVWHS